MVSYPRAKQGPEAVYTAQLYEAIKAAGPDGIGMDDLVKATGRPAKALLGLIGNMRGRWGRASRRTMVYSVKVFGNFARYFAATSPLMWTPPTRPRCASASGPR